jgi:hypothetical protein
MVSEIMLDIGLKILPTSESSKTCLGLDIFRNLCPAFMSISIPYPLRVRVRVRDCESDRVSAT